MQAAALRGSVQTAPSVTIGLNHDFSQYYDSHVRSSNSSDATQSVSTTLSSFCLVKQFVREPQLTENVDRSTVCNSCSCRWVVYPAWQLLLTAVGSQLLRLMCVLHGASKLNGCVPGLMHWSAVLVHAVASDCSIAIRCQRCVCAATRCLRLLARALPPQQASAKPLCSTVTASQPVGSHAIRCSAVCHCCMRLVAGLSGGGGAL